MCVFYGLNKRACVTPGAKMELAEMAMIAKGSHKSLLLIARPDQAAAVLTGDLGELRAPFAVQNSGLEAELVELHHRARR